MNDPEMTEIFGKPDKVTDHFRPTRKETYESGNRWGCGYWWKFREEISEP